MKKFINCILVTLLISILLCVGFACNKNTENQGKVEAGVFNTSTDYSGEQGFRNWYYMSARDELSEAEYMIYDTEMCTWRMSDVNCLIEPNIIHPGQLDQVIRAWKVPADGSLVITSTIQRRPVDRNGIGQDGCFAYIALNDEDYIDEKVIGGTDLNKYELGGEVTLKKGEMVYFVLNCSGNYTFDQTYWDITIEYTPA